MQFTEINPGVLRPSIPAFPVPALISRVQVSQLQGQSKALSTAAGIPQQVYNVAVQVANASAGTTTQVTVSYQQIASDANFKQAKIYVQGYNGNPSPVQVAASTSSPARFILNNTGENISIIVVASGNGGDAPLASAPRAGAKLPKSTGGGAGSSTTTYVSGGSSTPVPGPANNPYIMSQYTMFGRIFGFGVINNSAGFEFVGQTTGATPGCSGGLTSVGATGTDGKLVQTATGGGAGQNVAIGAMTSGGFAPSTNGCITAGILRSTNVYIKLDQTTDVRVWICHADTQNLVPNAGSLVADNPANNIIGFRYSTAAGDTAWIAYVATDATHLTAVSTGIAPDTNGHNFSITFDGTSYRFFIDNQLVATISSNMPASTTPLNQQIQMDNVGLANVRSFNFGYFLTLVR